MTSKKNTPKKTDNKQSLGDIVKEALANKQQQQINNGQLNPNDKDYRIGMPPRGTRRSMGKR